MHARVATVAPDSHAGVGCEMLEGEIGFCLFLELEVCSYFLVATEAQIGFLLYQQFGHTCVDDMASLTIIVVSDVYVLAVDRLVTPDTQIQLGCL